MFLVPTGTKSRVIKEKAEWLPGNFRQWTTRKENVFDKHEVAVDPVGKLGVHRGFSKTIGGAYAAGGYYGFARDGYIILVRAVDVEYLD